MSSMKKLAAFSTVLLVLSAFTLTGCGDKDENKGKEEAKTATTQTDIAAAPTAPTKVGDSKTEGKPTELDEANSSMTTTIPDEGKKDDKNEGKPGKGGSKSSDKSAAKPANADKKGQGGPKSSDKSAAKPANADKKGQKLKIDKKEVENLKNQMKETKEKTKGNASEKKEEKKEEKGKEVKIPN